MVHRIGVNARRFVRVVCAGAVLTVVGCAGGPSQTALNTSAGADPIARAESRGEGVKTVQVAAAPAVSSNVILVANKNAPPAATEPTVEPAEDSGHHQVGAGAEERFVYHEIFLLPAQCSFYTGHIFIKIFTNIFCRIFYRMQGF